MNKKKIFRIIFPYFHFTILFTILSLLFTSVPVYAAKAPKVQAHAYVIMDASTGKILLSKHPQKKIYPASTAKLMTALVVLDKWSPAKSIKITPRMVRQFPPSASKIGLVAGNSYTISDLLHMLLLPSAGDAAIVLAIATSGSDTAFAKEMNKKAQKLNMRHTSFDNSIGLDIGDDYYNTYGTAKDLTILARYAMSTPTIRSIVSKASYRVPKTRHTKSFRILNTNQFLSEFSYNKKLYQMIGGKTGTTQAAGSVLITTAKDAYGHEIICAFFGNKGKEEMYKDIRSLLNYTFRQGKKGKLNYKKGFWDIRYRKSAACIHKYYNLDKIPIAEQFYPEKKPNQSTLLSMIKDITSIDFQAVKPDKKMNLLDFAYIYSLKYPGIYYSDPDALVVTNGAINALLISENDMEQVNKKIAQSDTCTLEEKIALAVLLKKNVLPASLEKNIHTIFTKEQAVLLADQLIKTKHLP